MSARNHRKEEGAVLLASLVAMVIVGAMAVVMFTTASAEMQSAQTNRFVSEVTHLAESATVQGESVLLNAIANTLPVPASGTLSLSYHNIPYSITQVGNDVVMTDASGVQTTHRNYLIEATASFRGYNKTIHRVVDVGMTPIFQFAIFYDKDLELLPGPNMTLSGRVHTNQDLYVGVGNGNTLTINSDYFRSVGSIFRQRKDAGGATGGSVQILQKGTSTFAEMFSQVALAAQGVPSATGFDSAFQGHDANGDGDLSDPGDWQDFVAGALNTWNGTVQTGAHGVKNVAAPSIGSIQEYEQVAAGQGDYTLSGGTYNYVGPGLGDYRHGRYRASADLIIKDNVAYDSAGNFIPLAPGTLSEKTFYDGREKKYVKVTQVDMAKLNISGAFPANGLIFAMRSDSSSSTPNGIRLVKGSTLSGALTVVSPDPVYVQGDYNTVNKKPAAVLSDAVNLLSTNWNDSKAPGTLPTAKQTFYNFAMITGGDETVQGVSYNGGFENLPRFHENWSGVKCHILGSFVKIYASLVGQGLWNYGGDVYTAPDRFWDYDTAFNNVSNLPPFTPIVAQVKSTGWWE